MPPSRKLHGLRPDDWVFLNCLAWGMTEAEISRIMGRGYGAIHTRGVRIREYQGTKTQAQMVYWALDWGIIAPLPVRGGIKLTRRWLEVVELVAQGYNDAEIGAKLYLTRPTVTTHIIHAMDATGAVNRNNLVAIAWSEDLFV